MSPTLAVATGNHGWHLYYRHPGGEVLSRGLPGVAGVDVKADGGYCVLPPSVHPVTRLRYRWANHRPVEEMPARLLDMVLTPSAPAVRTAQFATDGTWRVRDGIGAGEGVKHPERLLQACLAAVRQAPQGRRRVTLYGAAHGVARVVLSGHLSVHDAVTLLVDVGRKPDRPTATFTPRSRARSPTKDSPTGWEVLPDVAG